MVKRMTDLWTSFIIDGKPKSSDMTVAWPPLTSMFFFIYLFQFVRKIKIYILFINLYNYYCVCVSLSL